MRIDFNEIDEATMPGMDGGEGTMSVRFFASGHFKVIPTRIHPGGSIGKHIQESGDDINYIVSGTGIATCDETDEELAAGVCHVCPKGSSHSIRNTGDDDLVMLTVIAHR